MLTVLLTLSLLGLALLLGATAYESVVMAPNYERDVPKSVELAREFLQVSPAVFFRVLAPVTQLLLAASVLAAWSVPPAHWPTIAALGALLLADVITFTWHYPRLTIMFKEPLPQDPGKLKNAARGWARGNVVRGLLLAFAFLAVLRGLVDVSSTQ